MYFVLLLMTLLPSVFGNPCNEGEPRDNQEIIIQGSRNGRNYGSQYRWSFYGSNDGLDRGEDVELSDERDPKPGLVLDNESDGGIMSESGHRESSSEAFSESLRSNKTLQKIKRDISQLYKLCRFGQTPDSNGIDYTITPQNGSTTSTTDEIDVSIDTENISNTFMRPGLAASKGKLIISPKGAGMVLYLLR